MRPHILMIKLSYWAWAACDNNNNNNNNGSGDDNGVDNYGNGHSNSGDDSVENEVMLMIIAMKTLRMVMLRMKSALN